MGKHLEPDDQPQPPIWRTRLAVSAVLMLVVTIATVYGFRWLISEGTATPEPTMTVNGDTTTPQEPSTDAPSSAPSPLEDRVVVHVAGEVNEPGIVELDTEQRVVDAIEGAGGATDDAAINALNLAAKVHDGEYILVPHREASDQADSVIGNNPPGSEAGSSQPVNLNTADTAGLETLPGVGPATAAEIIAHREQHGPFQELADIEAVSGIGPATRERLDGLVTW